MKRIQTIRLIAITAAICIVSQTRLRAAEVPADIRQSLTTKIDALMPLLAQSKFDQLLQQVGMTSDPDREEYTTIRAQLSNLPQLAGRYKDDEIVGYKSLGSRYQTVYVLGYYEKIPVMFEFDFYKSTDQWQPLKLRVETNFKTLIDALPLEH